MCSSRVIQEFDRAVGGKICSPFWVVQSRIDNEIKFALYDDGVAYFTCISNRFCAQQATPVFQVKKKCLGDEFLTYRLSRLG